MTRLKIQSGPEEPRGSEVERNLAAAVVQEGEEEESLVDDLEGEGA